MGSGDNSVNSPNYIPMFSDREMVTHGNIPSGPGVVGIIPSSQYKNKFNRARSNEKRYGLNSHGHPTHA